MGLIGCGQVPVPALSDDFSTGDLHLSITGWNNPNLINILIVFQIIRRLVWEKSWRLQSRQKLTPGMEGDKSFRS